MIFTKDDMLNTAYGYANTVEAAQEACESARRQILSAQAAVESNWRGDSGSAMSSALDSLAVQLNTVSSELSSAAACMRTEARRNYNNWPEETEDGENSKNFSSGAGFGGGGGGGGFF